MISDAAPSDESGEQVQDEQPLPLAELDLALTPLRRVVHWAASGSRNRVDGIRYLETNSSRWVGDAKALVLPEPIRELIDELDTHLVGFDGAALVDRQARMEGLHSAMRRIDALFGFPLPYNPPRRVARRAPPSRAPRERAPETALGKPKDSKSSRPASGRSSSPARPFRYWDGSIDTLVADLYGMPPAVADALSEQGVETTLELLFQRPTGYETIAPVQGAGREMPAGRAAMSGRLVWRATALLPDGSRQGRIRLMGAAMADVHVDGGMFVEALSPGTKVTFVGQWDPQTGVLADAELVPTPFANEVLLPKYDVDGVSDRDIRAILTGLLPHLATLRDPIPAAVVGRMGQIGLRDAMVQVHSGGPQREQARCRMGFDEAFYAHIGLAWSRYQSSRDRGIPVGIVHGLAGRLEERTNFQLVDEQLIALEDIKRDLLSATPMCRVLTGEVGVGKGAVALHAAVLVAEQKGQVMMLSPHSASAVQRFVFAAPLLRELGLVGRLVEGEISDAIRDALSRGEVHVLFGSLELLQQNIECRKLSLVIAEERGDWGHALNSIMALRSPRPHALIVTSTPVGAAVSMTAYATADWTVLASHDRQRVAAIVHSAAERQQAYERAALAIAAGHQVIVAFPLINGVDALSLRDAMSVVHALEGEHFQGAKVGLFHGALSLDDRRRAYTDLQERRLDVLVATTNIEDAPALPNVSVVLVEQADRVDLGRLQRLGGFVAASVHNPEAILVVGESDKNFDQRFSYVERASDGFAINDAIIADDLLGNVTAGSAPLPTFTFIDFTADRDLIWRARKLAHELLASNPGLRNGWGADVSVWLRDRWRQLWPDTEDEWACPVLDAAGPSRKRRRRRRRKR